MRQTPMQKLTTSRNPKPIGFHGHTKPIYWRTKMQHI